MKIQLDESKCVAAGQCAQVASNVFSQDEDGIVVLLDDRSVDVETERESVKQAVRLCPTRAISLAE
jgi:ferredoxin